MQNQYFLLFFSTICVFFFFSSHNFEGLLNVELTGANSGFADLSESIYRHWWYWLLIILLEESAACQLVILFAGYCLSHLTVAI